MGEIDITKVLETVIMVIIAPLMPVVVLKLRQWVNANVSQVQQSQIQAAVRMAVLAAEQVGLSGDEARSQAIMMAQSALDHYKIKVEFGLLVSMIEAEVLNEFNHPVYARPATVLPTVEVKGDQ
jgi:hypothetical protein